MITLRDSGHSALYGWHALEIDKLIATGLLKIKLFNLRKYGESIQDPGDEFDLLELFSDCPILLLICQLSKVKFGI